MADFGGAHPEKKKKKKKKIIIKTRWSLWHTVARLPTGHCDQLRRLLRDARRPAGTWLGYALAN